MERCDFCGSTELNDAKTYACEPFTQVIGDTELQHVEGWDACVDCARLIDLNDWDGVLQRAQLRVPGWKFLPAGAKRAASNAIREAHGEFQSRRLKTN
jgi:hypothetical protein